MDITLNEDQALIVDTARTFAKTALTPARIRALEEGDDGFDAGTWRQMVDMGWAGAVFPDLYGGSNFTLVELALIIEALGQGAIPSPIFSTVVEAGLLLLEAGSPAQRNFWLPRIADGRSIMTTAVVEAGGNLEPEAIRARLASVGGRLCLSGTKLFVRDAGVAEAIVCLARSGDAPTDLTWVLVRHDAPGTSRRRLRAAGGEALWEVTFDQVAIASDAIIGSTGQAWPHADRLLLRTAALKAAELAGIGQAALDLTVEYAKGRIQFGRPIGSLQAVHHHCTDMYRDVTVTRLLAWQAAVRLAAGGPASREVAMAKVKASEIIPSVTRTAHQIHGAAGYYRDYPLELYYHRAIAAAATGGDASHHRRSLARLLREDVERFRGDHRHELPVHHV